MSKHGFANHTKKMLDTVTREHYDTAKSIAEMLGETDETPREQILRACIVLGSDKAMQVARKAIAMNGKVLTKDKSRPRTAGGIFFSLLAFMREKKVISNKDYKFITFPYLAKIKAERDAVKQEEK